MEYIFYAPKYRPVTLIATIAGLATIALIWGYLRGNYFAMIGGGLTLIAMGAITIQPFALDTPILWQGHIPRSGVEVPYHLPAMPAPPPVKRMEKRR